MSPSFFAPSAAREATLYYGSKYAVMPGVRDELKTGTLHGILDELGLTPKDFR